VPEITERMRLGQRDGGTQINPNLGLLRQAEFELIVHQLTPGSKILELGGGSGYQAKLLTESGFEVISVDIDNPKARIGEFFPVEIYDGKTLPAHDDSFDYVISSNVLEHIPTLSFTLSEIKRVLRKDGRAIHVLPSSVWRWSTTLARYPFLLKVALGLKKPSGGSSTERIKRRGLFELAKRVLFERPHGEYPGAISELYYFSGSRWSKVFEAHGFEVLSRFGNGLYYTGYSTLPSLDLSIRRKLATCLGSSCHVFVMKVGE
jgi:SAM-dependent methyltransferase